MPLLDEEGAVEAAGAAGDAGDGDPGL